jgi:aromatic ring-opening dioxygenase LigB subunit
VHAVVDSVDEERLEELYRIANEIVADGKPGESRDLMTMLLEVRFDAPADFSENLDLYASGEKSIDDIP